MFHTKVQMLSARTLDCNPRGVSGAQHIGPAEAIAPNREQSRSDLARPVYCVLGLPIDAVEMSDVVQWLERAASTKTRFMLSTANLDFLVQSLSDPEFRETLLNSDLCTADGMPLVWIARVLGLPITRRVSGADLLETLRADAGQGPVKVFLFGGGDGISEAAGRTINATSQRLKCVGTLNPGFGRVEELSKVHCIETINVSEADFLIASLGAKKGQLWLHRNQDRLTIPVRAHLGAAVNFLAGSIKRAPLWYRRSGLEWLWRIKEEPYLWRRYAHDGLVLLRLLLTHVLPLGAWNWFSKLARNGSDAFRFEMAGARMRLFGAATEDHVALAMEQFELALAAGHHLVLDMANVARIDARFLGLILMLRKALKARHQTLEITRVPPSIQRMFRLHGADFLLRPQLG